MSPAGCRLRGKGTMVPRSSQGRDGLWHWPRTGSILHCHRTGFSDASRAPAFERLRSPSEPSRLLRAEGRIPDQGFRPFEEAASPKLRCGRSGRETEVPPEASGPSARARRVRVPPRVQSPPPLRGAGEYGSAPFASSQPGKRESEGETAAFERFLPRGVQGCNPASDRCEASIEEGRRGAALELLVRGETGSHVAGWRRTPCGTKLRRISGQKLASLRPERRDASSSKAFFGANPVDGRPDAQ